MYTPQNNVQILASADSGKTSIIWKWNSTEETYTSFQLIPTDNAFHWKYFEIDGRPFLSVANYGGQKSGHKTYSMIYQWHRKKRKFIVKQHLLTYGARSMEHFQIDSDHFLIVANSWPPTRESYSLVKKM